MNKSSVCSHDMTAPENDKVNHPFHYQSYIKDNSIECIDAMQAAFGKECVTAFCKANAFKYIWRCSSKEVMKTSESHLVSE